uniref:Uncharacterized protein n=1 Tax=Ceratitis capitata TaxID=7213 RepID=W8BFK2_CERCA
MSSNPQAPILQICQGGFGSALSGALTNNIGTQQQLKDSFQDNDFPQSFEEKTMSNNNITPVGESVGGGSNNYVNFTQFIMQHNLLGNNNSFGSNGSVGGGGGGVGGGDIMINNSENVGAVGGGTHAAVAQVNANGSSRGVGGGHGSEGTKNDYFNFVDTMSKKVQNNSARDNIQLENGQQTSNLFSNSLFSPYNNSLYANNGPSVGGYNNSYNNTNTNFNYFDNVYTPFGNNGGYYMNPFATGFDFTSSNLQASAPEFVPRFGNLSLNEKKFENTEVNNVNNDSTVNNINKSEQSNVNKEQHIGNEGNDKRILNGIANGAITVNNGETNGVINNISLTQAADKTTTNVGTPTSSSAEQHEVRNERNERKVAQIVDFSGNKSQNNGTNVIASTNVFDPDSNEASSSNGGSATRYTGTTNKQYTNNNNGGSRGSSANGFSRNRNDYTSSPRNHERSSGAGGSVNAKSNMDGIDKSEKPSARAERERERDRDCEREFERLSEPLPERERDRERDLDREAERDLLPLRDRCSEGDLDMRRPRFDPTLPSLSLPLLMLCLRLRPPTSLSDSLVDIVAFETILRRCLADSFSVVSLPSLTFFFFCFFSLGCISPSLSLSYLSAADFRFLPPPFLRSFGFFLERSAPSISPTSLPESET